MKNSKTLHVRIYFVLFSNLFLILLQSAIIFFSYKRSLHFMTKKADIQLEQILNGQTEFSEEHYFVVTIDSEHNLKIIKRNNINEKELKKISLFLKQINFSKKKGFIDRYRFLIEKNNLSTKIAFIVKSGNLSMLKNNLHSQILFSIFGIGIIFFVLIFVSKIIVLPLKKSEKLQKEFITSASHALKTPLTIISTSADLLETESNELKGNEWLKIIKSQIKNLTKMTNNLVTISKMQENQNSIKIKFPLSDVYEETVETFMGIIKLNNQQLQKSINKNISYFGNEDEIRQLLSIILENACKYAGRNGEIKISLQKTRFSIEIIVENTSQFYDEIELNKLFHRFYRGKNTTQNGFGIGLSVAKTILENHSGKIKLYMNNDKFCIRIKL